MDIALGKRLKKKKRETRNVDVLWIFPSLFSYFFFDFLLASHLWKVTKARKSRIFLNNVSKNFFRNLSFLFLEVLPQKFFPFLHYLQ